MDHDVAVISRKRCEVARVAGQDNTAAEPDGGRNDRRIDRMT
jgi:hypothetical protein